MGTHNIEELDAIDDEIKEAEEIEAASRKMKLNQNLMKTKNIVKILMLIFVLGTDGVVEIYSLYL